MNIHFQVNFFFKVECVRHKDLYTPESVLLCFSLLHSLSPTLCITPLSRQPAIDRNAQTLPASY